MDFTYAQNILSYFPLEIDLQAYFHSLNHFMRQMETFLRIPEAASTMLSLCMTESALNYIKEKGLNIESVMKELINAITPFIEEDLRVLPTVDVYEDIEVAEWKELVIRISVFTDDAEKVMKIWDKASKACKYPVLLQIEERRGEA